MTENQCHRTNNICMPLSNLHFGIWTISLQCNSQYELCYRFVPPFLVSLHWIYRVLSFVHGILFVFCRNERYLSASCFREEFPDCKVIFPLKNFDVFLSCRRWLYLGLYCVGKCYFNFGFWGQTFFFIIIFLRLNNLTLWFSRALNSILCFVVMVKYVAFNEKHIFVLCILLFLR